MIHQPRARAGGAVASGALAAFIALASALVPAASCKDSGGTNAGSGGAGSGTGGDGGSGAGGDGSTGTGGAASPFLPVCSAPRGVPTDAQAGASVDPGSEGDGTFMIGPSYTDAPELVGMAGVPRGTFKTFMMSSTASPTYPGLNGPYSRRVTTFVPAQYVPGTPAPFMVVQDGSSFVAALPAVLNNLIHTGRLPVLIAILIDSGGGDGPGSQRSLEYDTVSDAYVNFIENEVLPQVQATAGVTLTNDPDGRGTMGWSSGGAAAFTMGWQCPSLYRRLLTFSGTFVNIRTDAHHPNGAWDYHERLIAESEPRPLRVFLEVGDRDNNYDAPETTHRNWVLANQRMAAALAAKGYHHRFLHAAGAGHDDVKVLGQTLPETLVWLWRGYPID